MTDSKFNIESIANKLGIDKQFIKGYKTTEGIAYEISGNTDKKLEIPKQLTTELPQNFHLEFRHCIFTQEIIIFDCNISKNITFVDCVFRKVLNFSLSTFNNDIEFFNVKLENNIDCEKCQFKANLKFFGVDNIKVNFKNTIFKERVYFGKEIDDKNTEKSNSFGSCGFEIAIFLNCQFFSEAYFKNNEFKQAFFQNSKFKDNIYFNNSHFCEYADFCKCEFEKVACFYGVDFKKTPNFSQAIFKGNLNLINAKLNFDFEDLNKRINQEYNAYENQRTRKEAGVIPNLYKEKPLESFANDFRDSFRIFKNALIKDNNLLEASKYHKFELYAKEIELENKQPQKFSKDWIDKWVLVFYRILCDHHTNLISNLKWLVWLIALYSILLGKLPLFIWFPCLMLFICLAPLVYFLKDKNGIFVSQIISVVIILCVIFQEPKNIFGIAGLFTSDLNWWQNFITAVYTILIALVLFSFQKTARKNSIVPS
ncbi:MAG: pentapeptide repeat-containing protein [Helicobacter sp.]|nr:pentapeptide repeat-containing protein [Helicobacter sp.]